MNETKSIRSIDSDNSPTSGTHYIGFRAPADLYEWLLRLSESEHRSVSRQVLKILNDERQRHGE